MSCPDPLSLSDEANAEHVASCPECATLRDVMGLRITDRCDEVMTALSMRSSTTDPTIEAHLAECDACREAASAFHMWEMDDEDVSVAATAASAPGDGEVAAIADLGTPPAAIVETARARSAIRELTAPNEEGEKTVNNRSVMWALAAALVLAIGLSGAVAGAYGLGKSAGVEDTANQARPPSSPPPSTAGANQVDGNNVGTLMAELARMQERAIDAERRATDAEKRLEELERTIARAEELGTAEPDSVIRKKPVNGDLIDPWSGAPSKPYVIPKSLPNVPPLFSPPPASKPPPPIKIPKFDGSSSNEPPKVPDDQGKLQVRCSGVCSVSIDGEPRGHAPLIVKLNAGSHSVRVSANGQAPKTQSVTIQSGKIHSLTFSFHDAGF